MTCRIGEFGLAPTYSHFGKAARLVGIAAPDVELSTKPQQQSMPRVISNASNIGRRGT
jgi:hypothetical protein